MAAPALGAEIFSRGFRFLPTPQDAVTYYLPRLVAGEPLHAAVRPVVHRADVYACAPADLARRFCPLPRTGDRFFFTPSKRARAGAAAGSWHAQNTADIKGRGGDAKVGELRKLRYKKSGGVYTDWLMEEYSMCSGAGGESQFVLCKMYVSPRAAPTSAARQESAACFLTLPPQPPAACAPAAAVFMKPAPAPAAAPNLKRPAAPPQPVATSPPPCAKRMQRGPVLQPPAGGGNVFFPPPPPQPPSCAPSVPPTRPPQLAAVVGKMAFAPPPQPSCAPRRGSTTPLATQPSPASASAPALSPPVPVRPAMRPPHRPPMPLSAPQQPGQVQSKQRRILDPFEAAVLRDEAGEQTVPAAAPHPPPPPAATPPALQDEDDWDELDKALEF